MVALMLLFLGGCGSSEALNPENGKLAPFTEVVWELEEITSIYGGIDIQPLPPWKYTVEFRSEGHLIAQDACNRCEGTYEIDISGSISISASCTEMACTPWPNIAYSEALNQATRYEMREDHLRIYFRDREGQEWIMIHRQKKR